jgi:predicted nucleotidyltransferase
MTTVVDEAVVRLLDDLDGAGLAGYSAVLHGSAARGQMIPGWSDVNLVLVFDRLGPADLRALQGPLRRWREAAGALPLLLTAGEWRRSADSYPLEIAEMKVRYRVVRGSDPMAGLEVGRADLRLALERELRGKLLRLRQGYALLAGQPAELSSFVRRSASSVQVMFRGILILARQAVPDDSGTMLAMAGREAGFEPAAVAEVVSHRGEEGWRCTELVLEQYLAVIERAARFVDDYQIGEPG